VFPFFSVRTDPIRPAISFDYNRDIIRMDASLSESIPMNPRPSSSWLAYLCIIVLGFVLFAIRLLAPPNLLDQDQERPASYVLDAVHNRHWICQRDLYGEITSKPPMFTWLAALTTVATGRISMFSLYLPGALAAIGTACLLLWFGTKHFGQSAAIFAALAAMLSPAGLKGFGLARTDGLFAFTVTAAALFAFHALLDRGNWLWFWLFAAMATLTKGPLGVLLAGAGLLSTFWPSDAPRSTLKRSTHLPRPCSFSASHRWLVLLAYWQFGQPLIDKMLGKELLGHAITSGKKAWPGSHFYQPPLYYLGRAAPWSLLAYYALWRIYKHPSLDAVERHFERFLFCWFLVGLLLFSLAPHQRADLLWPIMPAGALVAGRELARLVSHLKPATVKVIQTALVLIGVFWLRLVLLRARTPANRSCAKLLL
jgi:4-amino-4-deoxy-L-arabinose transferase-like glycosyltransferase